MSFSKRQSRSILDYIERQKEHHGAQDGLNPTLEISGVHDLNTDGVYDDGHEAEAVEKPR